MPVITINHMDDPRVAPFRNVRDADLASRHGLFLVEGRELVRILLSGCLYRAHSFLLTPIAYKAIADAFPHMVDAPVYLAEQAAMNDIVGFNIHRGCIAAAHRPEPIDAATMLDRLPARSTVLYLESLTNHDNVGALFRNAAAFGVAAVVLSDDCCDPLYRKAVRVSMGGVLRIPFARATAGGAEAVGALRRAGFATIALTPSGETDVAALFGGRSAPLRRALMLGAEGEGLSRPTMNAADVRARIAMAPGVDSINVATAAAIALHRLADEGTLQS